MSDGNLLFPVRSGLICSADREATVEALLQETDLNLFWLLNFATSTVSVLHPDSLTVTGCVAEVVSEEQALLRGKSAQPVRDKSLRRWLRARQAGHQDFIYSPVEFIASLLTLIVFEIYLPLRK